DKYKTASISLSVSQEAMSANGKSSSAITAQLNNSAGEPVPMATPVVFSTTRGTFVNGLQRYAAETKDQTGVVTASLIAGTTSGPAEIICTSNGVTQYATVILTDEKPTGETAWITLSSDYTAIPANGLSSVAITAGLNNSGGKPVIGGSVTFSTTLGTFSNGLQRITAAAGEDSGKAAVSLRAGTTPGTAEITCSAGNGVTQYLSVEFTGAAEAGKIAWMTLQVNPSAIPANGIGSSAITVTIFDGNGMEVKGGKVTFSTTLGKFPNGLQEYTVTAQKDKGAVTVSLISGTVPGVAEIKCVSMGVSQSVEVKIGDVSTPPPVEEEKPAAIQVTADRDSVNPGGTVRIHARAYTASGRPLSGVKILFTLDNPMLGYITDSAATANDGVATADFTARELPGKVGIKASSGTVSNDPLKMIVILDPNAPSAIDDPIANPDRISVQGNSVISTVVRDARGEPVPNTTVLFEVENERYGTITKSVLTNGGGWAGARFDAGDQPGKAVIFVSSGSALKKPVTLTIDQAPAANIEFISAVPNVIAIRQSGGNEISAISFKVKDSNDNPLSDIKVSLKMKGPNGGEYIDPTEDGTPDEMVVATNKDGIALARLYSGYVAGPVTIQAAIDISSDSSEPRRMTVQSSVISIGGGMPSAKRFGVASERLNLPGLVWSNKTTVLTAFLADRFGNYNVLKGTTVSFVSEIGLAVDTSEVTVNDNGLAQVTVRTQIPEYNYAKSFPEKVVPMDWEIQLQNYLKKTYTVTATTHPRDGLCSILVYTKGEEYFNDSNFNGIYDQGESFEDTAANMFCDYNDNGKYDGPGGVDPEELLIKTGEQDFNGYWDANKFIFTNHKILLTGAPLILFSVHDFNVPNKGGSDEIKVLVCDGNFNPLTPGSTVAITTDAGKLAGYTGHTFQDTICGFDFQGHLGLIEHGFRVVDADPEDTKAAEDAVVTVTVQWEGSTYKQAIQGKVD
ncbi:MAG: Ig-like domain-containing protein, partial [Syntrophales bacterium LBB04]|nr:Ig-like domain-containing protein [Syntrophales bacterium LBB04]